MKKLLLLFTLLFTLLLATACNLPTSDSDTLSLEDQAGTFAVQTLAAITQIPTETETRISENTPTPPQPTVTPAPTISPTPITPTTPPKLPADPSLKNYNFFCSWNGSNNTLNVTIEWTDKAVDEDGYKLYRNGAEIANFSPNTVSYSDEYAVNSGVDVAYAIEAYNQVGVSRRAGFSVTCQ